MANPLTRAVAVLAVCLGTACSAPDGAGSPDVEHHRQPLVTNYNVLIIRRALAPLPSPAADLSDFTLQFRKKWQQVSFGRADLAFTVSPALVGPLTEPCGRSGGTDRAVVQRDAIQYAARSYDLSQFQHVIIMPNQDFTDVGQCSFSNSGARTRIDFPGGSYTGGVYLDTPSSLQYPPFITTAAIHEFGHGYANAANDLIAHTTLVRCPGPAAYQYDPANPRTAASGCQASNSSPIDFMGIFYSDGSGDRLQSNRYNFSGGKKYAFGWLEDRHVVWGAGSSELWPVDETTLHDGVYLHRYPITADRSEGYIVEYKKFAAALNHDGLGGPSSGGGLLPGVYVYQFSSQFASSKLLSTEPPRADTYFGVAPVAVGIPRLIDAALGLYVTVTQVGETAKVTVGPAPAVQVAGSDYESLWVSRNAGSTWSKATIPSPTGIADVTYGNKQFVAAGNNGALWASRDAETWRYTTFGAGQDWFTVTTCNGRHYAGGMKGKIASSLDGDAWSLGSPNPFGTDAIFGSACGNNVTVMVGDAGRIATTSQTGADPQWTTRYYQPPSVLNAVAFGAGAFVTVGTYGTILRSDDGITWTRAPWPESSSFKAVTYGDGRFLAVGHNGVVAFSDDGGRTWQKAAGFPDPADFLLSATYVPGAKRFLVGALAGKVWRSDDRGSTWTKVTVDPLFGNIQGIASSP